MKVREILVHKPGNEINVVEYKPSKWGFIDFPRLIIMQREHDELVKTLQDEGVKVHYLRRITQNKPRLYILRDTAVVLDGKAVSCHLSQSIRRGEEQMVKIRLKELGVKILGHIFAPGFLEGSDLFFIDKSHAFAILGPRSNEEGIKHLEEILKIDVTPIEMDISSTQFNTLNDIAIIDEELAYDRLYNILKEREYDLMIATKKQVNEMGLNFLQIDDNKIVNVRSDINRKLKMIGFDVIEVEIRELMKGNTGIRNMCLPFY
ncbi:MAG: arginine deiminase family protein [Candidatus Aenigmarchaeota archaeon]|nr:arginine deiminase family protein [Candidatus Aenigmarchaeota archaeon]